MARLLVATFVLFLGMAEAVAQPTCMTRDEFVETLSDRYAEQLVGRGIQNGVRLIEVFVADDSSSWTMIQTFPNGLSCVVAVGTDWLVSDPVVVTDIPG